MDKDTGKRPCSHIIKAGLLVIMLCMASEPVEAGRTEGDSVNDRTSAKVDIYNAETGKVEKVDRVLKSEEDWKEDLPSAVYNVTREKGTEMPFSGSLLKNKDKGTYKCAVCGTDLFISDSKFDSGTGWPSFSCPVDGRNVSTSEDRSGGMIRTEVSCARCGAHLGHVFEDGPGPRGQRFCINSVSLRFRPDGHERTEDKR